ncbi:MAG: ArgE/DapE family deacylase [Candidatus Nanopelagicales bacterium]
MTDNQTEQLDVRIDEDAILADLTTLVAFASVGGSSGETAIQQWVAQRLEELGAVVDCWDIDVAKAKQESDFPGMEVERTTALGVVGSWGSPDPALILAGHTDVVPPGDRAAWSGDPFAMQVRTGNAIGRGTCDMLGGVAAILAAVRSVRDGGAGLTRGLAVHSVSAEEDGGLGAWATLRRGHRGQSCVIAEPTNGELVVANGGALTFRLEVPGLATHGSTPTRGVSAVEKLPAVLDAVRALQTRRNEAPDDLMAHLDIAYPISVGKVAAGDWASTVPDLAVLEGRYGVRLGEDMHAAQGEFEAALAAMCDADPWLAQHPVRITWPGGRFASGRMPTGHEIADQMSTAAVGAGARRPRALGAPYGSDLRHYAGAGIATLQYGPGDVGLAHAADERVPVDELVTCARAYAQLILARCT